MHAISGWRIPIGVGNQEEMMFFAMWIDGNGDDVVRVRQIGS